MGDFNCRPGSPPYQVLVSDQGMPHSGSFTDTSGEHDEIDWILYKGNVEVLKYEEVDYRVGGAYPSDHNPIYVEFEWNQ
jgi:endonuclease/exonuclease/phosphatase family metal-dependent hydrolase